MTKKEARNLLLEGCLLRSLELLMEFSKGGKPEKTDVLNMLALGGKLEPQTATLEKNQEALTTLGWEEKPKEKDCGKGHGPWHLWLAEPDEKEASFKDSTPYDDYDKAVEKSLHMIHGERYGKCEVRCRDNQVRFSVDSGGN